MNGLLRAAEPGKAAAARSSSGSGGDEPEKQIDFAALKSTDSHTNQHLELSARALEQVWAGEGPRKTSRWRRCGS